MNTCPILVYGDLYQYNHQQYEYCMFGRVIQIRFSGIVLSKLDEFYRMKYYYLYL